MSEKQHRDKIASLQRDRARAEETRSKATASGAAARKKAADYRAKAAKASPSMARSHLRSAEAADKTEVAETKKAATASAAGAAITKKIADEEGRLAAAIKVTARKDESTQKAAERRRDTEDRRRRDAELRHAREVGHAMSPTVIQQVRLVPAPKPEMLRVLYLTASPLSAESADEHLRVDAEVRLVQQHLRSSTHRDLVNIEVRPAATPQDLIDGMNDVRPHVVHFAGHAGRGALLFDNGSVEAPEGLEVQLDQLARALASTSTPPTLVVLNGCDTLDAAHVLLDAAPIVVGMADTITDLAAATFAATFYRAIASAQPIRAALDQGALAVEFLGGGEESKPQLLTRADVDASKVVLVQPPRI